VTHYELPPKSGIVVTHFLTVADVGRATRFYVDVLGGTLIRQKPAIVELANTWVIMNVGGEPTDDKPAVTLCPPKNPDEASNFMNIRVADVYAFYKDVKTRGALFLTEPKDHGAEIRCYMRDPDGYLIEVGQTTASGFER